jgi:hypothetical protein
MSNKSSSRDKYVSKDFELEELKQPANDNYKQQPFLPLTQSNDNSGKDEKDNS